MVVYGLGVGLFFVSVIIIVVVEVRNEDLVVV